MTRIPILCATVVWALCLHLVGCSGLQSNDSISVTSPPINMQHGAGEQVILKDAGAPPLEIHPLHLSGQPSNRVNFVFFSDGCESHLSAALLSMYTHMLNTRQTRIWSETNSLETRFDSPRTSQRTRHSRPCFPYSTFTQHSLRAPRYFYVSLEIGHR